MDKLEKIREIIAKQLDIDPAEITPEATFIEDLGADSLDAVEIVMALEEAFCIEIPDEEAEQIKTVQNLLDAVQSRI